MENESGISFNRGCAGVLIVGLIVLILVFSGVGSLLRNMFASAPPIAPPAGDASTGAQAIEQPPLVASPVVPELSQEQRQALIQDVSRRIQIRTNLDDGSQPFAFVLELQTGVPIRSIALNPDESMLATGLENGLIVLWSLSTLNSNGQVPVQILTDHVGAVSSLAFDWQNGQRLASASADSTIKIWDIVSGRAVTTLAGHRDKVSTVAFIPNNPILASGSADSTIKLWDVNSGLELATMQGHTGEVYSLSVEPSAARMVSGGADNQIILWDLATQRSIVNLGGHTDWVSSLAYLPSGGQVASVSYDKTARIWTLNPPQAVQLPLDPPPSSALFSVSVHPSSRLLAIAASDNNLYIWNIENATQLPLSDQTLTSITAVAFSARGNLLAAGTATGAAKLWRVRPELIN